MFFLEYFKKNQLFVVTEQEGAEIWLNGENTGMLTPARVLVPATRPYRLLLSYPAHEDHEVELVTSSEKSFYYANLERRPLRLLINSDCEDDVSAANWG